MRWPVSRDRLDAMQRLLDIAHAEARQERSIADARYDALLEKYQALKVAGAVEAPKPPAFVEAATVTQRLKDDPMLPLIANRSGGNLRLRAMMLRQLEADRAANVSDADIEAGILNGVPGSGVPA